MKIQKNIGLKSFNTFGLDVTADEFVSVSTVQELKNALRDAPDQTLILGGGSNILLSGDFKGRVIQLNLKGIEQLGKHGKFVEVKAWAGENWHDFVLWCLDHDFGGVENLSLIPGNVGTAPMQNIGAYGVELKDVFVSCEAMDRATHEIVTFTKADCHFGYRESVFKSDLKGRYIILNVTFTLTAADHILHMDYGAIRDTLEQRGIQKPTIKDISDTVIAIRSGTLPDPKVLGNSGSFFKNPIVPQAQFERIQADFENMPYYPDKPGYFKIPAGWLIETAGFKGKRFGNYGVHDRQALVLVNHGGAKGHELLQLARLIQEAVKRIFDITLEPEVNII